MFLKIFQNSQGNTCVGDSFLIKLQDSNIGVFLWILRNFSEHLFSQNTSGGCLWHSFFAHFLECLILVLDDNLDEEVLLSFCLIFCQFQPDVAYKNVAYKKGRVYSNWAGVDLEFVVRSMNNLILSNLSTRESHSFI